MFVRNWKYISCFVVLLFVLCRITDNVKSKLIILHSHICQSQHFRVASCKENPDVYSSHLSCLVSQQHIMIWFKLIVFFCKKIIKLKRYKQNSKIVRHSLRKNLQIDISAALNWSTKCLKLLFFRHPPARQPTTVHV